MGKGAFVNLTKNTSNPTNGKDQVVWKNKLGYVDGGRSLDVTAVTADAIYAGHIVVMDKTTEVYRPLEVSEGAFSDIKENDEIVGLTVSSIRKDLAFASMVTIGIVNEGALPYIISAALKAKVQTALPGLQFHKY